MSPSAPGPAVAAVPRYLGQRFEEAPPGHRFGPYFACWRPETFEKAGDDAKGRALREVAPVGRCAQTLLAALLERARAETAALGGCGLTLDARATAPFATGLGMEHPVDNGFAFLAPYGLPYLPGSGVKGVVRSAAEELALAPEASGGWDLPALWWLLGFEAGSAYLGGAQRDAPDPMLREAADARRETYLRAVADGAWDARCVDALIEAMLPPGERGRWRDRPDAFLRALAERDGPLDAAALALQGALRFRDVLLDPPGDRLEIEILTPHHTSYYQKGSAPHDAEAPVPNAFLVVPAGARLAFHVECAAARLPVPLRGSWQELVAAAFGHAFEWLGFGAKTAVGYGQVTTSEPPPSREQEEGAAWLDEQVRAVMDEHRCKEKEAVVGKPLAERWAAIADPGLKGAVKALLEQRWEEIGRTPSKKAAAIYEAGDKQ